jgi:hypothetical protein
MTTGSGSIIVNSKTVSGAPFAAGSANNGLSVKTLGGKIVLGQDVGDATNPAILLSNREVPMGGFSITFKTAGSQVVFSDALLSVTASGEQPFQLRNRTIGLAFPVPVLRPRQATQNCAMDIMPNGAPGDFMGNGIAWIDVCNTDCISSNPALSTARVGAFVDHVEFGSRSFNGAPSLPVRFTVGANPVIEMLADTTSTINLNSSRIVQSQSLGGSFVGYTMLNIDNTNNGSDAIMFIGNDLASSRFGFLRWSNAAATVIRYHNPNQFEVMANLGAINGLVLGALLEAPIKFVLGGDTGVQNREVGRFDPATNALLLGATANPSTALLYVNGGIEVPGTVSHTYKYTSASVAPSTVAFVAPATVFGSSTATLLGTPAGWVKINVAGTDRVVPFY